MTQRFAYHKNSDGNFVTFFKTASDQQYYVSFAPGWPSLFVNPYETYPELKSWADSENTLWEISFDLINNSSIYQRTNAGDGIDVMNHVYNAIKQFAIEFDASAFVYEPFSPELSKMFSRLVMRFKANFEPFEVGDVVVLVRHDMLNKSD